MGWTADFADGVAELIAAAPDLGATYRAAGAYLAGELPIIVGPPPQSPDAVLALSVYPLDDEVGQPDSTVGLQIRIRGGRGDSREIDGRSDALFAALHELGPVDLSTGVHVHLIERRASSSIMTDQNDRPERSDTYWCTVHRPTTNRPAD